MNKKVLRKLYREKRKNLTALQQREKSLKIIEHIENSSFWKNSQTIGAYIAIHREVDLSQLFQKGWQNKKQMTIPFCHEMGKMDMLKFDQDTPLFLNTMQIPEPKWTPESIISPKKLDLILIPALAIDYSGIRLGYGGGFYDRYLEKATNTIKVGVIYDFSFSEIPLPRNHFDLPVDYVVTEKNIFKITL